MKTSYQFIIHLPGIRSRLALFAFVLLAIEPVKASEVVRVRVDPQAEIIASSTPLFQARLMGVLQEQPVQKGSMMAVLEGGNLYMNGFFMGLTAPWIQIELRLGHPDNGAEALKTWLTVPEGGATSGSLHLETSLTAEQQQHLNDGLLYLYVRTLGERIQDIGGTIEALPVGDRQFLETSVAYQWRGALAGAGNVTATLEGSDLRVIGFASFDAPVGQVSLYKGAFGEAGELFAIIYLDFGISPQTGVGFDHTLPLSEELKQSLLDGMLYLDFTTYGTTRARAQLLLSPNQAPAASQITVPAGGSSIAIGGANGQDPIDPETPLAEIEFTTASDPDGNAVGYLWQLSRTPDFSLSRTVTIELGPAATTHPLTVSAAAALFDSTWTGFPIPLQTPVTFYHRMITTDGARYTYGEAATVTLVRGTITADEEENGLPSEFALHGNYPNPFNPSTSIVFDLPARADVRVDVFDLLGRQVLTVPAGTLAAGAMHRVEVDGASLPSGSYIYRILAVSENSVETATGNMVLIK